MNICIPSQDDRGLDSEVNGHFGSAPWFTFVNTGTGEVETIQNPACHTREGGCHHVGMLSQRGVEAVIVTGIGRRAWTGLRDAGIKVYSAPEAGVRDVVRALNQGAAVRVEFASTCSGGFQKSHRHRHGSHGQNH